MNLSRRQGIRLVVFDFDGTIADTSEGIIDTHRFTLEKMMISVPSVEVLKSYIGENLLNIYLRHFSFNEEKAKQAVDIYRKRYSEFGIHMAFLYPGIKEMLKGLHRMGIIIGIATLKAEQFVKSMIEEMGIVQYFDCVFGMDSNDTINKPSIILKCCEFNDCSV